MTRNYFSVTEIAGNKVTKEQMDRMYHRYYWASRYCKNKNVIELACGTGPGLGLINNIASNLIASDIDDEILLIAKNYYKSRIKIEHANATLLPYNNNSIDIIIIFEAIYYLENFQIFIDECVRVLTNNGKLLISSANSDLFDFNPSPYSFEYYGVRELSKKLKNSKFEIKFYGYLSIKEVSLIQRVLRPIKKILVAFNIFPKSMKAKEFLKKIVFGSLVTMPNELSEDYNYIEPTIIDSAKPNKDFKVIYCEATINNK